MRSANEVVTIEMTSVERLKLYSQLTGEMERRGLNYANWDSLDLGIELPAGWPVDVDAQPTIAQLTVLAVKLQMRVIITDLNMVPADYERPGG